MSLAWHPHDLRHAMATHGLAEGISPKVVSERLGHSSVAFTLQVYAHALPNQQAEAAEKMATQLLEDPEELSTNHSHEPGNEGDVATTEEKPKSPDGPNHNGFGEI
jgi:hypothetical protein